MNDTKLPRFDSFLAAEAHIAFEIFEDRDHCDNWRAAFLDDAAGMSDYDATREDGCCGTFDFVCLINGRAATVGCNHRH